MRSTQGCIREYGILAISLSWFLLLLQLLTLMNATLSTELLDEAIDIAEEEGKVSTYESFRISIEETLPPEVLNFLRELAGDDDDDGEQESSFLKSIWSERYESRLKNEGEEDDDTDSYIGHGCCLVCERHTNLTRHHVYPRETHRTMIKKGLEKKALSETIPICKMCHRTIHKFFSNEELANNLHSLELLLSNEKFYKYAKWAGAQRGTKTCSH